MEYSKNFEKVKNYYVNGLWTITMVLNVVGKKTGITEEEYSEITGYTYPITE